MRAAVSGGGVHTCAVLRTARCGVGGKRLRAARQRDDRGVDHSGAGDRPVPAPSRQPPVATHLRAAGKRDDPVLGAEPVRATRERDHHEPDDAGTGQRDHWRRRPHCRVVAPQLRAPWRRHGAVLGRERLGSVRQRHQDQFLDSGHDVAMRTSFPGRAEMKPFTDRPCSSGDCRVLWLALAVRQPSGPRDGHHPRSCDDFRGQTQSNSRRAAHRTDGRFSRRRVHVCGPPNGTANAPVGTSSGNTATAAGTIPRCSSR